MMQRYQHPDRNDISRTVNDHGFNLVTLSHTYGYRVVLSEYGAQILSWQDPEERELLFLSKLASFEEGKAIRGGIPIVFPQFGKGELPSHGFARTKQWQVVRQQVSDTGTVSVTMRLTPDEDISNRWPNAFVVELDVILSDVLVTTLRVVNDDIKPFSFFSALHTYFNVGSINSCLVQGLKGVKYTDFLRNREEYLEESDQLKITAQTDRAYQNSPEVVVIEAPEIASRFMITKEGLADTVVWNPWIEGSRAISDLEEQDYLKMLCVESGNILTPIELQPGEMHSSGQVLRVERG